MSNFSSMQHLADLAKRPERQIIGLMSGTSLDGLDVAWCSVTGNGLNTRVVLKDFLTIAYDEAFKAEIRRVFAKQTIDFQHLVLLNVLVAEKHAAIVNDCLAAWRLTPNEVDLIASHGQTVFHAPRVLHGLDQYPNATLQIGDGDHLAMRTGIVTVSDFRQKHLAAGGEGAPLAMYGDYFLYSSVAEHRFLLNIGGIANFTWLPANGAHCMATDTGPGNTLLDAYARQLFGVDFDENGLLAAAGMVDDHLLSLLKSDPFFSKPLPRTIGPELFNPNWVQKSLDQLPKGMPGHNPHNLMATLARLTAETAAEAMRQIAPTNDQYPIVVYVSGGGAHNPAITGNLTSLLRGWSIRPMAELGIPGDAKEAVLFAILANETITSDYSKEARLGGLPLVKMGKISLPG